MEEQGGHSAAPASSSRPRDGCIDFSGYSLAQLQELQDSVDRQAFPQNFANLLAELERRRTLAPPATAEGLESVRFTPGDGLRGWWQAVGKRLLLYGPGSLEVKGAEVILQGWQRTWLGMPQQTVLVIPSERIRNVARDKEWIRFEWARPYLRARPVELQMGSVAAAQALVARLPRSQTHGFQDRWSQLREFERRVAVLSPRVRVTQALVLANTVVYVAMAITATRPGFVDLRQLIDWGGNFGPLTLKGEGWRLIGCLFLHADLLHLALNMWALWNVGRLVERLYGQWPYLLLYFCCGLIASATSLAWNASLVSVGASGAIFGLLAAFLVFFVRRRSELPAALWRAHWPSTLAFVVLNILSGAINPVIDNAAHLGGLTGGLVLGWLLALPLDPDVRREFPFKQTLGALMLTGTATVTLVLQVAQLDSPLTPYEQYFRVHDWYVRGADKNLGRWQELAVQGAQGSISDVELGRRFTLEIKPFWLSTAQRLAKESITLPAVQRPIAKLLNDMVQVRLKWSDAVIEAGGGDTSRALREIQRLSTQASVLEARLERLQVRTSMDYKARSLSQRAWVLGVRRWLPGGAAQCVKPPALRGLTPEATDATTDGPAAREAAGCLAQRLFMGGEYSTLDSLISQSAQRLEDLPDGSSTLTGIFAGLDNLMTWGHVRLDEALSHIAGWRRAVPGSAEPDLLEAEIFRTWAWSARGEGAAPDVSRQAWALFAYRTEMAAAAMEDAKSLARSNPHWYELSLDVGVDQSDTVTRLRVLFDEGLQRFPGYLPLYGSMLRVLMPRWFGSYQMIDQLIRELSGVSGTELHGDLALYARLYWVYASLERDEIDIFTDALAQWPTMKTGFVELRKLHPRSDAVLNGFAKLACVAHDQDQYAQLRPLLEQHISSTVWSQKVTLKLCDAQRSSPPPSASRRPLSP